MVLSFFSPIFAPKPPEPEAKAKPEPKPEAKPAKQANPFDDSTGGKKNQKTDNPFRCRAAYFNDAQRQADQARRCRQRFIATRSAKRLSASRTRWKVQAHHQRADSRPTRDALAYGLDKTRRSDEKIAVYDLGGGTFDVSIISKIGDGVFEVKATNGDTHLGGDDFDNALIDHHRRRVQKEHGIDLRNDRMALQRLKEEAEKAKIGSVRRTSTDINLPFITADAMGPKHINAPSPGPSWSRSVTTC